MRRTVAWLLLLALCAAPATSEAKAKPKAKAAAKAAPKKKPAKPRNGVPIGTASTPDNAPVKLTLTARFQQYQPTPDDAADVYDTDITSPKSSRYSADGKKVYINSLEGFATVVYDAKTLAKLKVIKHEFGEAEAGLFHETDAFDYQWIAKGDGATPNVFRGKPVESDLSHGGKYLWVPYYRRDYDLKSQSPSAIAIIDTARDEIVRVMPTGPIPKFVRASPDGKWVAIAHWGDNTLMLVDTTGKTADDFKATKLLVVGHRVDLAKVQSRDRDKECSLCLRGMEFTKDSAYLLVARMGGGGIAVFDMATQEYVGTAFGMKATPRHLLLSDDGKWLFLSSNKTGYVSRIETQVLIDGVKKDARAKLKFDDVSVGTGARTIDFAGGGKYVIAAVNNKSKLVVVDALATKMKVVAQVPVDSFPVGLAVSPDGAQLFVTSQGKAAGGGNSVGVYSITYREEE